MNSKNSTDNVVCISCGADVRQEALYCYNCGGVVVKDPPQVGDANSRFEKSSTPVTSDSASSITDPNSKSDVESGKASKTQRRPLTAAMLRRKRASNRQPVEVVWEEPSRPSMIFVTASIVLTIFSALVLAAALYLK